MATERKYLATYIDAAFDTTYSATNYTLLGADLEELSEELNPDVETVKNILGESSVKHNGFEPSMDTDPYYYYKEDALAAKVRDIAMDRVTGDGCKTSLVQVWLQPGLEGGAPTCEAAWREDVMIVPTSVGGDTSGIQIPFTVHFCGNRKKGTFDPETKKFT